jgi:MGT family glycosyltransferase
MTSYLFALIDAGGSVPPELGAARRLVARGHRVDVLAEDSMRDEINATGATFRPWVKALNRPNRRPEHDPLRDWESRNPLQLMAELLDRLLVGPAPAYASDVSAALQDLRPDVAVCSCFALGAMVAAEAASVPYAVLMTTPYLLPAPGMPPFGLGATPASGLMTRIRDRVVANVVQRQWNKGLDRLICLRRSYGLGPINDFWDQVRRANKVLVMTSRDFDFPAKLPPTVHYVGAVLDDPTWAADEPWTLPPGDRPLVLVTMSSTFQDQGGCLQRVIDGLATLPVRGLVTTGHAIDPKTLRSGDNVAVVPAAPHSEVLKHTNVVITHGGHGTVVRALAAGVPMVILPQGRDQADNAARVTARGAGVRLKATALSDKIADAVRSILDDARFQQAAKRLGQVIRADAQSGALVTELENIHSPTAG